MTWLKMPVALYWTSSYQIRTEMKFWKKSTAILPVRVAFLATVVTSTMQNFFLRRKTV